MSNMKLNIKNILKVSLCVFSFSSLCVLATGCGSQFFIKHYNTKNATLKISKTEKTSGNVIKPDDVTLTNTIPELVKNKAHEFSYLYQSGESIDVLVLPIHFKNNCNTLLEDEIKANIDASLNGSTTKKVYPTSVKEFYSKSSFGKINLNFVVADWFTFSNSKNIQSQDDVNNLIDIASKSAKQKGEKIDLKKFDKNNDGFIDAVWAIYDMPNYTHNPSESGNDLFWAYTISRPNIKNNNKIPVPRSYSFASYDFMDGYSDAINARTYIHETGHLFGLVDYYDYGNLYYPTAGFDMMDLNLFDHNAYSKMTLGWMKPYVVYGDAIINEEEFKNSNSCIVILEDEKELNYDSNDNFIFSPAKEYMLIDYFDASESSLNYFDLVNESEQENLPEINITKSGYRLYHIDSRLLSIKENITTVTGEFYNSSIPLNSSQKCIKAILNSSSEALVNEQFYLKLFGLDDLINASVNYYNEATLIAANSDKLNQSYSDLYYTYNSSTQEKKRTPLTDDILFKSGDKFKPNLVFSRYFVNGGYDSYFCFNDINETFSTSIEF